MNQPGTMRNGSASDARYTKEQLLTVYRLQKEAGTLERNIEHLFQGPWDFSARNGTVQARSESKEQPGPEVCWNPSSDSDPFGLVDMSDAERQVCHTSGGT